MSFPIPCAHESGQEQDSFNTPDYRPLTQDEIAELLREAQASQGNVQRVSQIQDRLAQGIVDMTCPRPVDGPIATRLAELDRLYVEHYADGPTSQLVHQLHALMS